MPVLRSVSLAVFCLLIAAPDAARSVPLLVAGTGDPLISDPSAQAVAFSGDLFVTGFAGSLNGGPPNLLMFLDGGAGFDPVFTLVVDDADGPILKGDPFEVASSADGVVEALFATTLDLAGLFGDRLLARIVIPRAGDPLAPDSDIVTAGAEFTITTPVPAPGAVGLLASALIATALVRRRARPAAGAL